MAWIAAGATVLGAIIGSSSSSSASDDAAESDAAALAFEQQRYDDWQNIYGPIQENLAQYYTDLSPDQYEVEGLEAIETEKARTMKLIDENFAQRGISSSGLAKSAQTGLEFETMRQRADVRRSAPGAVADEKMRFLQVGLGQDPGDSMSRILGDRAADARARAETAARSSASATQTAIETTGTALADYLNEEKG